MKKVVLGLMMLLTPVNFVSAEPTAAVEDEESAAGKQAAKDAAEANDLDHQYRGFYFGLGGYFDQSEVNATSESVVRSTILSRGGDMVVQAQGAAIGPGPINQATLDRLVAYFAGLGISLTHVDGSAPQVADFVNNAGGPINLDAWGPLETLPAAGMRFARSTTPFQAGGKKNNLVPLFTLGGGVQYKQLHVSLETTFGFKQKERKDCAIGWSESGGFFWDGMVVVGGRLPYLRVLPHIIFGARVKKTVIGHGDVEQSWNGIFPMGGVGVAYPFGKYWSVAIRAIWIGGRSKSVELPYDPYVIPPGSNLPGTERWGSRGNMSFNQNQWVKIEHKDSFGISLEIYGHIRSVWQ
ncbi:MAG: hypothetical protein LBG20_02185 [Holosporaceae bacterium]|jgi:hypothetical protein|nr:hypothetical protein [Holosporaceae bacterium]